MVDLLIGVFIVMASAFASLLLSLAGGVMCRTLFTTKNRFEQLLDNAALLSLVLLVLCLVAFSLILGV